MRYAYLVPEGYHDVEVIGRILELHGAVRIRTVEELQGNGVYEFWKRFVDLKFPHIDRRPKKPGRVQKEVSDFTQPMPVPYFYQFADYSIAIHCAGGDFQKIGSFISRHLTNWDGAQNLAAFAVFCDADEDEPVKNYQELKRILQDLEQVSSLLTHFVTLTEPGQVIVEDVPTRVGLYIFPDNTATGTLENVLIHCAAESYPELFRLAGDYVDTAEIAMKLKWNDAKKLKATIGSIANVLRPGASNRVTIQHDEWIGEKTIQLAPVARLDAFLSKLLDLQPLS